ncbi:MAG: AarF/ABC1/UbiB kinase family protein [Nitrospirae bacterium]|nr:AarF/ABC1/UbiB kinase family protein [Nitrospirota bacterium]
MSLLRLLNIKKTYRNVKRVRQIVRVLLKHGLGRFVEEINLQRYIPISRRLRAFGRYGIYLEKATLAERTRLAFEELGPSFIKLGQLLSARPDLVTKTFADEFRKLLDEVPPFPSEEAVRIIGDELKRPLKDVFSFFDETPVAAASIAQAHHANLKDGTDVIVKVCRPNIEENIENDIAILYLIARLMLRYIPESRFFNPIGIVDEFSKNIKKEMDFIIEADNATTFRKNFEGSETVYIPKVYYEYTTRRVLTMERLIGIRIDDFDRLDREGFDRKDIARKGTEAYFKQLFEDGFFHADPHPGNIFILEDGRMGLMDFGIVGRLSEETMEGIANTFLALIHKDFDRLVQQYIELGLVTEEIDTEKFRIEFKRDLIDFVEPLYSKTLGQIDIGEYLDRITQIAVRHNLKLPSDLLLVDKALLTIEGLGRRLDPDFNLISVAEPYATKFMRKKMSPKRILTKARKSLDDIADFLNTLPRQLRIVMRKVIRDDLHVKITHIGLDRLIRDIDRSSNRLSFSLIIAAIIIGSAVIIHSGSGRLLYGLPALGLVGFAIAFLFGAWLLIGILRSGRL